MGGAFTEPATLEFFFDLGIPVANGYGLTEAGTVITVNDMNPFRSDTVGKPLPGTEVRIRDANADGIGEVVVRGKTVMSHYLDDPELTKPFYVKHNCSTCYLVAAHLAGSGTENLYDKKYYRKAQVKTPVHDEIGETFNVDQYQYPPPFLLGPHLVLLTGLDFLQIRALWFAFSVMLFVLTSGVINPSRSPDTRSSVPGVASISMARTAIGSTFR